ncbi:uncharacterized protein LOC126549682 [Aphis gossypii]|uniref:uncharacterized protein LOC126549682 n=1 Tax=Aphis gossypii TaxID=80765 RepID=UPI002159A5A3|nr:uncharacterized protein LOC126549682 [Aphis gossypii]
MIPRGIFTLDSLEPKLSKFYSDCVNAFCPCTFVRRRQRMQNDFLFITTTSVRPNTVIYSIWYVTHHDKGLKPTTPREPFSLYFRENYLKENLVLSILSLRGVSQQCTESRHTQDQQE